MSTMLMHSGARILSNDELLLISGGRGNPTEQAFVGAAGFAGGWAGSVVGTASGMDFGGAIGAIVCSPAGPEASAVCGGIGALIGKQYGSQIAGMTGTAAGLFIGQQIWNYLEDHGLTPASLSNDTITDPNDAQYEQIAAQAPSDVQQDVGGVYSGDSDPGAGDSYGDGGYDGGDAGGGYDGGSDYSGGGGGGNDDGEIHYADD